jgi:hypothetical protein
MLGRLLRLVFLVLFAVAMFAGGWLYATIQPGTRVERAALSTLERGFVDQMKGSTLVGWFTIAGREDRPANPDRYEIHSVEKIEGDEWRFNTRMQYGKIDVTLPVVVTMLWSGDTPMITMTDVTIPSLGTFTARVFFYGDRYAGTWQHGDIGGHMYGKIEKPSAATAP